MATTSKAAPLWRLFWDGCSFIGVGVFSVSDTNLGGLHALRVQLGAEDLARAAPINADEFDLARVARRQELKTIRGVALVTAEVQVITMLQHDPAGTVKGAGQIVR